MEKSRESRQLSKVSLEKSRERVLTFTQPRHDEKIVAPGVVREVHWTADGNFLSAGGHRSLSLSVALYLSLSLSLSPSLGQPTTSQQMAKCFLSLSLSLSLFPLALFLSRTADYLSAGGKAE